MIHLKAQHTMLSRLSGLDPSLHQLLHVVIGSIEFHLRRKAYPKRTTDHRSFMTGTFLSNGLGHSVRAFL